MDSAHPDTLFYYCSADEALNIIAEQQMVGHSPARSNGTTELNHLSQLSFTEESLTQSSIKLAVRLIFGTDEPQGDSPILTAIRRWRETERFMKKEEAYPVLKDLLDKMVNQRFTDLSVIMNKWRHYCQHLRIISLFEKADDYALWDHYADAFSGVIIKFQFTENSDLQILHKVTYQNTRPEITSIKEQYGSLFYNLTRDIPAGFQQRFLNKAPHFAKQKEWRLLWSDEENTASQPEEWVSNYTCDASCITEIQLGPYIDDCKKELLLQAIKSNSEKMSIKKITQRSFVQNTYDLTATSIAL